MIYSPSGSIAYANAAWEQMLHMEHMVGTQLFVTCPDMAELTAAVIRTASVQEREILTGSTYLHTHSIPYYQADTLHYILTTGRPRPHTSNSQDLAYARQQARPGDNICILREDLSIVASDTDTDSLLYTGSTLSEYLNPNDIPALTSAMEQARQQETSISCQLHIRQRMGMEQVKAQLTYFDSHAHRWILAAQPTRPLGGRIIDRLCIAWSTDNSSASLARAMGLTRSAVSRYRKKESVPAEWLIRTYVEKGISVHWLYTGHGHKFSHAPNIN